MAEKNGDPEAGFSSNPSQPSYGSGAPPAYDADQAGAPPSYDSIIEKMKAAKQESSGTPDYLKRSTGIICSSVMMSIVVGLSGAIPVAMIVIGSLYTDDCPDDRMIPIWLIVMGSFYNLRLCLNGIKRCVFKCDQDREQTRPEKTLNGFIGMLDGFCFIWFITGNVFVYRAFAPNTTDPTSSEYCHPTCYYFAFWVITATYIVMVLGCCCACSLVSMVACCCAGAAAKGANAQASTTELTTAGK